MIFNSVTDSPIFLLFSAALVIALDIYFHKIALKKVFFKKYKYITINSKFKEITNSFNIKTYIKIVLATCGAIACIFPLYYIMFADIRILVSDAIDKDAPFPLIALMLRHWIMIPSGLILCIAARLLVFKRIVTKNAEISHRM